VGADPPAAAERDIDRVAHDRMAEREPPRDRRRPHERAGQELVERLQGDPLRQLRDCGGQPELERVTGDRRAVQQPPRRRAQRRELRGERRGHRARHRRVVGGDVAARRRSNGASVCRRRIAGVQRSNGASVCRRRVAARRRWRGAPGCRRRVAARRRWRGAPGCGRRERSALRLAGAGQLLEVERVAARGRVHGARRRAHERGRLGLGQRPQRQRGHAAVAQRCREGRGQRRRHPSRARREGEQHRRDRGAVHERGQRVERRRVRPVHVVEAEHERPGGREALEEVAQRAVHAVAVHRGRLGAERRERGRERARVAQAQAADRPLAQLSEPPVERLREQGEGQVGLELGGSALEHGAARRPGARRQEREQARFADPRLALKEHDAVRGGERVRDRRPLGSAPDQLPWRRLDSHGADSHRPG
jgi:hypothetical protein